MRRFPFFTVIIVAALIAGVFLFLERLTIPEKPEPRKDKRVTIPEKRKATESASGRHTIRKEPAPPLPTETKQYKQVAIIIDDIGFDLSVLRRLANIPAPIAFAVIPYTPHAAEAAEFLYKRKREILLHLPMEPLSYPKVSPGAGALMVNMDKSQIIKQLREDLTAVPHASGVNNHMGSRFMEDPSRLKIVMEELETRGLYFIDSRTSPHSLGKEAASQAGIRFAERNIFIDHKPGYEAAIQTLRKISSPDKRNGNPQLLIGHPHVDTIRAIEDIMPAWEKEGIRVVDVTICLDREK
jgi:polysaccharide deacetylase 2 family uncharacterized protein YibQ